MLDQLTAIFNRYDDAFHLNKFHAIARIALSRSSFCAKLNRMPFLPLRDNLLM